VVLIRSLSSSVAFFISHFRNDTVHRLPKVFNTSVSATSPLPTLTLTPITGFVLSFLSGCFPIFLHLFGSSRSIFWIMIRQFFYIFRSHAIVSWFRCRLKTIEYYFI